MCSKHTTRFCKIFYALVLLDWFVIITSSILQGDIILPSLVIIRYVALNCSSCHKISSFQNKKAQEPKPFGKCSKETSVLVPNAYTSSVETEIKYVPHIQLYVMSYSIDHDDPSISYSINTDDAIIPLSLPVVKPFIVYPKIHH